MALTLTTTINASIEELTITGTVPASILAGYRFRFSGSDEIMELVGFHRIPAVRTWPVDPNRWLIHRGLLGTTATSHTNGATVQAVVDEFVASTDETAPGPVSEGGGSGFPVMDFIEPTTATPEAIVNALIASGRMDAS